MGTLRDELMDMVREYRKANDDFANQQSKDSIDSIVNALRYKIRADSADVLAMKIHSVLVRHGL